MKWRINFRESTRLLILASSAMSAAGAAAVTYAVTNKILEKKFQDNLEQELEKAKVLYQSMYSTPVFVKTPEAEDSEEERIDSLEQRIREASEDLDEMPADVVGRALGAVRTYDPDIAREESESEEEQHHTQPPREIVNLFDHHTPPGEEVLDALLQDRDPSLPYIITKAEFLENEPDFDQKSFTFYEGDSILVDDQDEYNPIEKTDMVAGDENLLRFGYGSGDEFVLYVRNETLQPPLDLHITKSTGKYAVEVMALDDDEPHLQHSRPQKFRIRDE